MLIENFTKSGARMLARLRIGELSEPVNTRIWWLNTYTWEDSPALQSKNTHKHTYFEAHFLMDGGLSYRTEDGTEISVAAGGGILIPPDVRHRITSAQSGLVKMTLAFLPAPDSFLYDELSRIGIRAFSITDGMLRDFEDIFAEIDRRGSLSRTVIRARVVDLVCALSRAVGMNEHAGAPEHIMAGDEMGLAMVRGYIQANSGRLLTCKEVASECHYSEKYLGHIFKEHTGMTLLSYIHREKMNQAQTLLRDPSLSLRDVSAQLGFSNEYYFNSFFRRLSGITPGQFRRCGTDSAASK